MTRSRLAQLFSGAIESLCRRPWMDVSQGEQWAWSIFPIDCIRRQMFSTSSGIVSDCSWNLLRTIPITADIVGRMALSGIIPFARINSLDPTRSLAIIGVPLPNKVQRSFVSVSSPSRTTTSICVNKDSAETDLLAPELERIP